MIDISRSRRGAFYRCVYWKRDLKSPISNNEYILKKTPNGVFYAKIVNEKSKDTQDIANAFRMNIETITIQTEDKVDLIKDDLVFFNNGKWIVENVGETPIQKNAEFSCHTSNITRISLKKGE